MILADAHLHFFRRGFPGTYGTSLLGLDVEVYERLRAVHGIAAALVVGYEGEGIDPGNNAYVRELAATRPWMATVGHVELASRPDERAVSVLLAAGHAGIALYAPDAAAAGTIAALPRGFWQVLDGAGAIISLNATPEAIGGLGAVVRAAPGCRFLFAHVGLPGAYRQPPSREAAEARIAPLLDLAALPNVLVKISGLYAISDPMHAWPHEAARPFVDLVLARFGPARCLWASDFAPALDFVSFAQTVDNPLLAGLGEDERGQVMGGNLLRLLGRPDS
jgi:predicted TIM-barrel fold metal-dependent hydrolase